MKKVLKIFLVITLALVTALGMMACNNGSSTGSGKKGISGSVVDGVYEVRKYYVEKDVTTLNLGTVIELPEGVTQIKIKKNAFAGNNTLKEVIVPSNTKEIEAGAFAKMQALETLELPFVGLNFNADPTYNQTGSAEEKAVDSTRTIAHLFGTEVYDKGAKVTVNYGSSTTDVYMPASLKKVVINNAKTDAYNIPMYAFNGVTLFENIELKGNIVGIGEYAFSGVGNVRTIELPETVKTIYKGAFSNSFIKNVIIGATTNNVDIKEDAFKGCSLLNYVGKYFTDGENTKAIKNYTIDFAQINVVTIGTNAFDLSASKIKYDILNSTGIDLVKVFGEDHAKYITVKNA